MSGITGIFSLDGAPFSRNVLQRMTDIMAHRGPDASSCWSDGPAGFGHRMFCTTPESLRERQPLVDDVAGLALVWDGRIDNRGELSEALKLDANEFTDADLALRAYAKWDGDFLPKLIGDFALAIWDKHQRRLLCARDALGQRPLYYWYDGKTFLFASEFQPFFEFPGVAREPNLQQAARWLLYDMAAEDETIYEGIFRVRSAQSVIVDRNGLQKTLYWRPDPEKKTRYRTPRDYSEHFHTLFQEAVRCRMRATSDVGVLVSGGLDSTSIACMAQKLRNEGAVAQGVQTFSTIYDTLPCDERQYIQAAVEKWRLNATLNVYEQHPEWLDFGLTARFPDSFYSPTDHPQEFSQMRDRGIRVYFDGIGGDELLAPDLACITRQVRDFRFVRAWKQLRVASRTYGSSIRRFGLMYGIAPFVPKPLKRFTRPVVRRINASLANVVCQEYLGVQTSPQSHAFLPSSAQFIYDCFYAGSSPMAMDLEELLACRFPLECRRPFADRRLLEFILSIPEEQIWRVGQPVKTILRDAMHGVLPEKVRTRTDEAEFSPLIQRELRVRQRQQTDELIRNSCLVKFGVLRREGLDKAWRTYCESRNVSAAAVVMYTLMWELWYRCSILKNLTDRSGPIYEEGCESGPA